MRTIYKYPLEITDRQTVKVPGDAQMQAWRSLFVGAGRDRKA